MKNIDYEQKYLKYKKKYTELKILQEQNGGNLYLPGDYVFFIPQYRTDFDSIYDVSIKSLMIDKNGTIIKGFDDFTNYLGNCAKFLRVGKTTSGYDLSNTFNTIYTNQGVVDSTVRKTSNLYNETKNVPINEPTNDPTNVPANNTQSCNRNPSKLSTELLLQNQNDVNPIKLEKIIKFINDNNLQGSNPRYKISRIICIKKPSFGKSTIYLDKNYIIEYNQDNTFSIRSGIVKTKL